MYADDFIDQLKAYIRLNRQVASMGSYIQRVAFALTLVVTAKIGIPCESATQVISVAEISVNGDCGIVSGERGYALGS